MIGYATSRMISNRTWGNQRRNQWEIPLIYLDIWWMVSVLQENNKSLCPWMIIKDRTRPKMNLDSKPPGVSTGAHGKSDVLATFYQLDMDSCLFNSEIMDNSAIFCLPVACCLHRSAVQAATGPPCTSCWPTSLTGPCRRALHKRLGFKRLSLLEIPHGHPVLKRTTHTQDS